jgi:hypothetical protein
MRYGLLILVLGWGCDQDTSNQCDLTSDAGMGGITIEFPHDPPFSSEDLVLRGTLKLRTNEKVYALYVGGIAANADAPNYASFNVTISFAALQARALAAGTPTTASLDVTAVSNCDRTGAPTSLDTIDVTLRAATTLTVTPNIPIGYVPSTKNTPVQIDVKANKEAAGLPLTVATSQGTLLGTSMLALSIDATAAFFLLPDPTKEGKAAIDVQAGLTTGTATVRIVGPPTLNPGSTPISPGIGITVFVSNSLNPNDVAASIAGCSAVATPKLTVSSQGIPFQNAGLTSLGTSATFVVSANSNATGGESATVTCYDSFGQSTSATYKVP